MFIEKDDIDWLKYSQDTNVKRKIREKSDYQESLDDYFAGNLYAKGCALPWEKAKHISIRPSEVSLWAGVNGHGKSLLLGQVVLGLVEQGQKCLIASFEMRPEITLARMVRQAAGQKKPASTATQAFTNWKKDQLYLYDHHGMIDVQQMLAVCRYATTELGITQIVIDSLMKCVKGEDDMNGQKDFVNALCALSRDSGVHIHLVHHMRKGSDEKSIGGKFDLKGSGSITDQADNVFIVWKNKEKAQLVAENPHYFDREVPDAVLVCEKQRNGEWEGKLKLWFDYKSQQFIEEADTPIHRYLEN
jgi:twinkle protein